jgi:hypothetical protein
MTMSKQSIRESLVLWQACESEISELPLQAFATRLLLDLDPETGGTTVTLTEYSKKMGIATRTMWKYAHELKASGEWDINLVKGQPTTYKPLFIEEALAKFNRA